MKIKLFIFSFLFLLTGIVQAFSQIGYVIGHSSETEMSDADDDEHASYNWFKTNYPEGKIITCQQIADGTVNLNELQTLWIHIDRIGLEKGVEHLPTAFTSPSVIDAIETYYDNGGNLFLSNHATQYIIAIGRLAADRAPGIFGSGEGGEGTDNWTFNANIGYHPNEDRPFYNHENHPIYEGLEFKTEMNPGWEHKACGLIGPGHREDHNCMWDLNSYGFPALFPDAQNVVATFEQENNAVVLGTWGHVVDYCCAGIVEFNPTNTSKGRCIAIGLAAYEWNQNDHANIFQGNIEKITNNILSYLTPLTNSGTLTDAVLSGIWNEKTFAQLNLPYNEVTTINFTDVIGMNELPSMENLNPNCLIYIKEGTTATGISNIIINRNAPLIELKDGYDFNITSPFHAEKITYTRNFTGMNGWASLCLPFIPENIDNWKIEEFSEVRDRKNVNERIAVFKTIDPNSFQTDFPYILKIDENTGDRIFIANNADISITQTKSINFQDGLSFKNNYRKSDGNGFYMLRQDGVYFAKGGEGATIGSFRAYMENNSGKKLMIAHENDREGTTEINPITERVNLLITTKKENVIIYTKQEQEVFIYTIDGRMIKKINLIKGSNTISGLGKGIYFINKEKVIIK